jgi:formylglycine-generating enzyme required for sulfatase activity
MTLVLIPAGEFMMGSDDSDPNAEPDEFLDAAAGKKERHRVRITKSFYLGIHEVTRGQFRRFVDETGYQTEAERDGKGGQGLVSLNEKKMTFKQHPKYTWRYTGFAQTDEHPVVNVTWNDAQAFTAWLGRKEGKPYRLPTEAEWEYACRAGTTSIWSIGDDEEELAAVGNISDGTAKEKYPDRAAIAARDGYIFTAPVGRFRQNAFGLFDMHGNVWEWCSDGFDADYYKWSPVYDPPGPVGATFRISRGGSWADASRFCRSADRWISPEQRGPGTGFRIVLAGIGPVLAWPAREVKIEQGPTVQQGHLDKSLAAQAKAPPVPVVQQPLQANAGSRVPLQPMQPGLGKAHPVEFFTCNRCGATIRQFPAAVDFEDLKSLEDNCRVHLQASRWERGQETGKLDKTEFVWIGPSALVDIRELRKPNDAQIRNNTEFAHVFVLMDQITRIIGYRPNAPFQPARGGVSPILEGGHDSVLVGRSVWVESQFLKTNNREFFEVRGQEVYFGQTHLTRRKIQDFWAEFCERYSERSPNEDPQLRGKIHADYVRGMGRIQQRILGMANNNVGHFRTTETTKLLNSLATKYKLTPEEVRRMIEPKAVGGQQEFWRSVDDTFADVCDRHEISLRIAWIILGSATELGLETPKPQHQEAIDALRVLSYKKNNR